VRRADHCDPLCLNDPRASPKGAHCFEEGSFRGAFRAVAKSAATRQGLLIGRSPRPETLSRVPLDQLLACIHRGPELRQEVCPSCGAGTRIKVFACGIHGECQLDDKIAGLKFCGNCDERSAL
jgi:hypothetical protein